MLQFDAFISCISTLCQNTPGHVLLLFRMCGGRIIGRLLYPSLTLNIHELTAQGLEDGTRGQLHESWTNMVSLGIIDSSKRLTCPTQAMLSELAPMKSFS